MTALSVKAATATFCFLFLCACFFFVLLNGIFGSTSYIVNCRTNTHSQFLVGQNQAIWVRNHHTSTQRKYGTIIKSMTATRQEGSQGTFWHMDMFTTLPLKYIKQAIYNIYLDICQQHLEKSQPKQIRRNLSRNLALISQEFSRT